MVHKNDWADFIGWCKPRGNSDVYNHERFLRFRNGVNYRYDYTYDWYDDGWRWHIIDAVKIYNGDDYAVISMKAFNKLFVETGTNLVYKCKDDNLKDYGMYYLEEELC